MDTFGALYEESVVPSISYTLGKVSNASSDRHEVKIKPRGGTTYWSTGARTIEFTITDSNSYMLWNTLKLQCKMRNTSPAAEGKDLEFVGPVPAVCFESAKLSIAGQTVELIENYAKAYVALDSLLPQQSRVSNGAEALPLVTDGASSAVKTLPRLQPVAAGNAVNAAAINQGLINSEMAAQQPGK